MVTPPLRSTEWPVPCDRPLDVSGRNLQGMSCVAIQFDREMW